MIQRCGADNIELVNRANKAFFDERLANALVKENPKCYPFVPNHLLTEESVRLGLLHDPANITSTCAEHINPKMIEETGGVSVYEKYLPLLGSATQRVFCENSPSLIPACGNLSHEDLFALLPMVDSEDMKTFIMKKLGK